MSRSTVLECQSCEHMVSSTAKSCPSCGAFLRKSKRELFDKLVIFALWGFNVLVGARIWRRTQSAAESSNGIKGAGAAGAAIGTNIGVILLIMVWLIGAFIFGLMALLIGTK